MPCEYCLRYCEHDRRCPNYTPIDTGVVCDICGEIIEYGDEYVENEMGEYAHLDCVDKGRDMANFLEKSIRTILLGL